MTNPNIEPSAEVSSNEIIELVLDEDWRSRFTANSAGMNALGTEISDCDDPDKLLDLTEVRGEALTRTIGAGVLSLFVDDVAAKRQAFEDEFGS